MKRQLFTQEGKEYIVKSINNSAQVTYAGALQLIKQVFVNYPSAGLPAESIAITTNNRIIPLSYSVSFISNTNAIVCDIANCYFMIRSGPGNTFLASYRIPLGKIYPYVQRIYYTDANNNNFISRYNQLIFSDADFISPDNKMIIYFRSSLANAMVGDDAPNDKPLIPIGTYTFAISFTYLELQK